jgi:hypothetical protein
MIRTSSLSSSGGKMNEYRELLRQALYVLMCCVPDSEGTEKHKKEIVEKIRELLAKEDQP